MIHLKGENCDEIIVTQELSIFLALLKDAMCIY